MKKTIIYILIALMMGSMFASAIPFHKGSASNMLVLQCTDISASEAVLKKAVKIMESRLETARIETIEVRVSDEGTIGVILGSDANLEQATSLLLAKGELGFYETASRNEVYKILGKDHPVIDVLHLKVNNGQVSPAVLGYCDEADVAKVSELLVNTNTPELRKSGIIFAWGSELIEGHARELFLLKGASQLDGSHVEKASIQDNSGKEVVLISFDKEGGEQFEILTSQNVTRPVAIVLDHLVYSAPVVQQAIKGGKCAISGNFSHDEVLMLSAIIGNGELPLDFDVIH